MITNPHQSHQLFTHASAQRYSYAQAVTDANTPTFVRADGRAYHGRSLRGTDSPADARVLLERRRSMRYRHDTLCRRDY